MSISNLTVPNNFNLFANTLNVRDLVAEKIENRTGGNFVGPWSDAVTYNDGDVVIYMGCLYTSIANDNLNNIPSQTSTFWTAASLLKNTKLYNVDEDTGDDTKAVAPCGGPYPFKTLDAAYTQALLDNPTGNFGILIQRGTYSFSQDITVNNVRFLALENQFPNIVFPNTITVTGASLTLTNLALTRSQTSPNVTPMFIFQETDISSVKMVNCSINFLVNNFLGTNETSILFRPSVGNPTRTYYFTSPISFVFSSFEIEDLPGEPLDNLRVSIDNYLGRVKLKDSVINEPTSGNDISYEIKNCSIIVISHNKVNLNFDNCDFFANFVSNADDPAIILLKNCSFYSPSQQNFFRFRKLGTAIYNLINVARNDPSDEINPSISPSSFDMTAGPQYDYEPHNTYSQNNLVLSTGTIYKSLVNSNIGNTPASSPTQWVPYAQTPIALVGSGAVLSLLATTSNQLIPLGAELVDASALITIAANVMTFRLVGLYEVSAVLTSATTSTAGQDSVFNVYADNPTGVAYPGDWSTEVTRGLVSNAVTYPSSDKTITLFIDITTANQPVGFYARNTGSLAFDINFRTMGIKKIT